MTTQETQPQARVEIDQVPSRTIQVPVIGTAPLIVHNFAQKAKMEMLSAQQGQKRQKAPRDPQAEYEAAFYRIAREDDVDAFGFPITAFKAATVGAARIYGNSVKMTELRQFLFMHGVLTKADAQQLVEITGEPRMREDVVRLSGPSRSADLRYRPEFPEWSAVLRVTYITTSLSESSVLSLIDAGGLTVGVGEWRPEKRGDFGTYAIDQSRPIEVVSA